GNLYLGTNHLWRYAAGAWANYSGAVQPVKLPSSGNDYIRAVALSNDFQYLYTGSLEGSVWVNSPNGTPTGAWTEIEARGGNPGTIGLPNRTVTWVKVDYRVPTRVWVTLSGPAGVARVWRCDNTMAGAARTWVPLPIKVGGNTIDIPACCI